MASRQHDSNRLKILLTQECARLMVDEGIKDFLTAKRKAAARLGITNKALLPANADIEQAVLDYQRLFRPTEQASHLRGLRQAAVAAMRFLVRFRPRLVGAVLAGTAGPHSEIALHVFADTAEEIALFLLEHRVPFETSERRLRLASGEYAWFPVFGFGAGTVNLDLTVFDRQAERTAPRSPVDGRPMRRAGLAEVEALLEEEPPA